MGRREEAGVIALALSSSPHGVPQCGPWRAPSASGAVLTAGLAVHPPERLAHDGRRPRGPGPPEPVAALEQRALGITCGGARAGSQGWFVSDGR